MRRAYQKPVNSSSPMKRRDPEHEHQGHPMAKADTAAAWVEGVLEIGEELDGERVSFERSGTATG